MDITVQPAGSGFALIVDGVRAGEITYRDAADVRDINHTEVYPAFAGQGLSKPLIEHTLADARSRGLSVIPSCSAVAHYMEKNPDCDDLRA